MRDSPPGPPRHLLRCLVSVGLLVITAGTACSKKTETTQQTSIAIPAQAINFAPDYVAADRGFWKAAGLDVKLETIDGIQTTNALLAGNVDFANITSVTFLRANARGQKLVAIANVLEGTQTEVVVSKAFAARVQLDPKASSDARAKLLRGARIAVDGPNGFPNIYLKYVAKHAGLDPDRDLVVSPIAPPAMLAALESGQIDGIAMAPPWTAMARSKGLAVTAVSSTDGDYPELVPLNHGLVVTRPGHCDAKPEMCRKMVDGLKKAIAFMHENPTETATLVQKRFEKTDPKIVEETLHSLMTRTPHDVTLSEAGFTNAQQFLVGAGSLREDEKLASFTALYTNTFAK